MIITALFIFYWVVALVLFLIAPALDPHKHSSSWQRVVMALTWPVWVLFGIIANWLGCK